MKEYERIVSALEYIEADCSHDDWAEIGMEIKTALKNEPRAIYAWLDWSSRYPGYNEDEAIKKWHSFDANKVGGRGTGSLIKRAKEGGWRHVPGEEGLRQTREQRATQAGEEAKASVEALQDQARAQAWALSIWQAASEARADHPYLVRKGVVAGETLREIDAGQVAGLVGYRPQGGRETRRYLSGRLLVAQVQGGAGLKTVGFGDQWNRKRI